MTTTTPGERHRKALEAAARQLWDELCPGLGGYEEDRELYCHITSSVVRAYQAAIGAEPVAWASEIAEAKYTNGAWTRWRPQLSWTKPNVPDGSIRKLEPLYAAPVPGAPSAPNAEQETWRDCPEDDERWSAGCDFALEQLCKVLRVDPGSVNWDAATETLDGDVQATIANILDVGLGNDDWKDFVRAAALSPPTDRSGE